VNSSPWNPPLGPLPEAIFSLDGDLRVQAFNEGAEFALGYSAKEVEGTPLTHLLAERFRTILGEQLRELAAAGDASGSRRLRLFMLRQDGGEVAVDVTFFRVLSGEQCLLTGVLQRLEPEAPPGEVRSGGGSDPVTALADRRLFQELADQSLYRLGYHGRTAAVLLIDLNRFQLVTNTLGREGGDELLSQVGQRLSARVRPGDIVGRAGGDQFAVFLNDLAEFDDIAPLVLRFLDAFEAPFQVHGHELAVSVRVGVSVYPSDSEQTEGLLRAADLARSRTKMPVNSNWAFYAPELERHAWERLELESQLKQALEHNEFHLVYQPIVDLASDRLVAVEALIRWDRPEVGPVSPEDFISLLEETGMIVPVGEWVVRTAARQLVEWRAQGVDGIALSVNLSPRQLADSGLEGMLDGILRETGLSPTDFRLEITESLFLRDLPGAETILGRLRERGFGLSLDDFGTGYSALGYLRHLPFDRLKLDRSFIENILRGVEGTAMVRGIIHLAETLGIITVAEGVERQEQAEVLRWLGCPEAQGFGFSPPVAGETIAQLNELASNWPQVAGKKGGTE